MSDSASLRQLLVGQYDALRKQLSRRLGSEELAADALQETYLHLACPRDIGTVGSPHHYLLTIALNIARMRFRSDRRCTSLTDLEAAHGFVDETPDPLRSLEGREDIAALQRAFDDLTPRRRRIFFAARIEEMRLRDIARECGLSQRAIEKELKAALTLCALRLNREVVQRFGPRAPV